MTEEDVVDENMGDPWCETGPRAPELVVVYWGLHSLWICNIIIGFVGTYKLFQMKDHQQLFRFKLLYVIISVLFIISPPGFAFGIQAGWECWYNDHKPWEGTYMVGLNGYGYGLAILYLFFLLRLKTVFDWVMKLSRAILMILTFGLLIQLITPILWTYYFLAGWNEIDRGWALMYFNIFTATNIICAVVILILFIKRILALSKTKLETHVSSSSTTSTSHASISQPSDVSMDIQKKIKKYKVKQQMLSLTIRYMVCAMFALLSTMITVSMGLIRMSDPNNLAMRGIHIWFHIFDETVNLIALYLQFPFGQKLYMKCCGCINHCFESLFIKLLNINVSEKHVDVSKEKTGNTCVAATTPVTPVTIEISV